MKTRLSLLLLATALVISTVACEKNQNPISTQSAPTASVLNIQPGELTISNSNAFIDPDGNLRIVGLVVNNTNTSVNSIQLLVEIRDSNGNSLLKDDSGQVSKGITFYPFLYNLAPAQASPFSYTYNPVNGSPASYGVSIVNHQVGDAVRADLKWEDVQIVEDGLGWFYLTGTIKNLGNSWVHINSLAGGVLDDNNRILSTEWTSTYATILAPAGDTEGEDKTPFSIIFPNPQGSTKWDIYWDANPVDTPLSSDLVISVSNAYIDQFGSYHLVGEISNKSTQAIDSMIIAGLYSADGTVIDSSYSFVPIPIQPGIETPFSIASFSSINRNPNQPGLVNSSSAQPDIWYTTPTTKTTVELSSADTSVQKESALWKIEGKIVNTSQSGLRYITVMVIIKDAQNKLIAMDYTTLSPSEGESILPGEGSSFSISVPLDPNVDSSSFTLSTLVLGDVK